jgi:hypothetical protein
MFARTVKKREIAGDVATSAHYSLLTYSIIDVLVLAKSMIRTARDTVV